MERWIGIEAAQDELVLAVFPTGQTDDRCIAGSPIDAGRSLGEPVFKRCYDGRQTAQTDLPSCQQSGVAFADGSSRVRPS
jgi:hypothetical protein